MGSGLRDFKAGDTAAVTFEDSHEVAFNAIITGFASDRDEGMSPEIQDYVACWINVKNLGSNSAAKQREITLGTDYQLYLDGSKVTLLKQEKEQ